MMYLDDNVEAPNFWGVQKIKRQAGTCYFWDVSDATPQQKIYR